LRLAIVALGFAVAQFETWRVVAPVLERQLGPVRIDGSIVETEPLPDNATRITLAPLAIQRLDATHLPSRIRVNVKGDRAKSDNEGLLPGDFVSLHAILFPPPAPAMPGAYDFQRRAFFDRLGAVGFAVSAIMKQPPPEGEGRRAGVLRSRRCAAR